MTIFEDKMRTGGQAALQEAELFFMREDAVHQTLKNIAGELEARGIAYATLGGMALVAHGYVRTTVDVDLLLTASGLEAVHQALEGRGYVPLFEGSRGLRDTRTGVRIEFLVAGQFPGDGKPKPVAFPDPAQVGEKIDGVWHARLSTLVELKLASGMTNPGRLRDLADVQELIRALQLPRSFGERLDPYVRAKFDELWLGLSSHE